MSEDADLGLGFVVSRETSERFLMLEALIKKWNPAVNLVSKASMSHFRTRHILDSVQLFRLADRDGGIWCDLGSGGGFPGLVVAILAMEVQSWDVRLVESDGRKAAFLREATRQLDVRASVLNSRIEELAPLAADVISARALSALQSLCEFAVLHLNPDGVALFPKGASYEAEVMDARNSWEFDLNAHPSVTEPAAAILELRNIRHA